MKEENFLRLLGQLDEKYIAELGESYTSRPPLSAPTERSITPMNPNHKARRWSRKLILAAAAISLLTLAALAVGYNIHQQRQQELRATLKIDEAQVQSYQEYAVPAPESEGQASATLLSSIPSASDQKLYVNLSPVEREVAANFPDSASFFYCVGEKGLWGIANPVLRPDRNVMGDAIGPAVLEDAYDEDSKTLTLCLIIPNGPIQENLDESGQAEITLLKVDQDADTSDCETFNDWLFVHKDELRYGSFRFTPSAAEMRRVDFVPVPVTEPTYGHSAEVLALELNPTEAKWHIRYEGMGQENPEFYTLQDYVCINSRLVFSDGREMSTGGSVTCRYESDECILGCGWSEAVNISALEAVYIGDVKLEMK